MNGSTHQSATSIARERILDLLEEHSDGLTFRQMQDGICDNITSKNSLHTAVWELVKFGMIERSGKPRCRTFKLAAQIVQLRVDGRDTCVPDSIKLPVQPIRSGIEMSVFQLMSMGVA